MVQRLIEKMELHDTLNPKLWEGENLRPEVEEKLDEIVDQFILELHDNDIPIKVLDARLVGSNASFNYTDNSDLDIHIVANFEDTSCDVPVLNLLYNYFKKNFNDKYAISVHGVPVELYVEDINSSAVSNGIYSLYKGEWIKFPEPIEVPDIDITALFNPYKEKYYEIMEKKDAEAASDLIDELYLLRKDSIATDGEYGEGNLVFKEFRNKGFLDNLKQLMVDETSKELSLESLNESKEDNNIENIKRYIKNNFNISTYTIGGPFYILSNGLYLNLGKAGSHLGLDDELYQNGIIEQDPFDYSYLYPNTIMVDLFNAIRCSDGENLGDDEYGNPYIQLPKNLPTNAQLESLDDWIYSLGYNNKLFVDGVEYNLSEVSSEYVIKRIKRYYSSGQLYESSNEDDEQIAYDPKTASVVEWLNESKEDNQKLVDHVGEETAQRFFKLKSRIKTPYNDLYYWLKKEPVELEYFLNDLESTKSKSQQAREDKAGADLIYSSDGWKIYKINTYDASKHYGKGTKWCISGNYPGEEGKGEMYFDSYKEDGVKDYYFIIHGDDKWAWLDWEDINVYDIEDSLWEADDTGLNKKVGEKPDFPESVIDALPNARPFFDYHYIPADEALAKAEETGILIVDDSTEEVVDYYLRDYRIKKVITNKTVPLGWFQNNEYIEEVIIKAPCKYIGRYSFAGCPKLKSIYIASSVYLIDDYMVSGSNADLTIYCESNEPRKGYAENCFADVMDQDTGELLPAKVIWSVRNFPVNESLIKEDSENIGYHYGDLGKADYKHQFGGRNTGGFGTGIYFVGTPISQRKDGGSYKNRPEHKIDLSKYNLFRPRNNEQAYRLHDALLTINNMAPNFKRVPKKWDEVLDEFDKVFDDYYAPLNALDDDDHSTPVTLNKQALLKYIRKYIDYYPYKLNKDDDLMDIAREIENNLVDEAKEFYYILNSLSSALGYYNEEKLRKIVIDALQDKSDIAPATLIMKALGYDGIDVRHLNHDDQGLSGLDNFGFGSVIYDLKESVEETGRTVIKVVVFHNEDQSKKQIPNFQDFEEDGLYRLGENDYIVFEKRWEEDPRGWGMIHAEVIDDFVIPVFSDYRNKYIEEAGLEIDNLQPNSDLYYDLRNLNTKTFSKYINIIKRAIDKYFK